MQKTGRRMLISLIALVLTVTIFIVATYAWFEMGNSASTGFKLGVVAKTGLLVSPEIIPGGDMNNPSAPYVSNLQEEVLARYFDFDTVLLDHLSPVLDVNGSATLDSNRMQLEGFRGESGTDDADIVAKSNIDTLAAGEFANYYEFTLWFKAGKQLDIYLDMNNGNTTVTSQADWTGSPYWNDTNSEKMISYSRWHKTLTEDGDLQGKYKYDYFSDLSYFNAKYPAGQQAGDHVFADAMNALRIGIHSSSKVNIVNPNPLQGYFKRNLARELLTVSYPITEAKELIPYFNPFDDDIDTLALDETHYNSTKDGAGTDYNYLVDTGLTLQQFYTASGDNNFYGKLTFTVWVEGKDGDCLNSILADLITTKLVFMGIDKTPVAP